MQHSYSVACFDFPWIAEKSDYPLRFLLSREPSLLFSLKSFFKFQTHNHYTIWKDSWWIKRRGTFFFSVQKYLFGKLLYPFSRPGELEEPILCVVNFDLHERCISINWETAPSNFSFLKHEKYHLISKKHFIHIWFEIQILFHCLLFRNIKFGRRIDYLCSFHQHHHYHHPHRRRRHHLENVLTWQQHIVAGSHINLVSPTPPSL